MYSSRQVLLNKIASEAAKRADWSLLNGIPYDEIFNSDDDVTLGMNPVFAAWSGSYPDNWSNWVGGAPTKETSIVRVGSNAVRMTASGSDRGIQCDAISFTSTPSRLARFSAARSISTRRAHLWPARHQDQALRTQRSRLCRYRCAARNDDRDMAAHSVDRQGRRGAADIRHPHLCDGEL